jgi:hypothetical protein
MLLITDVSVETGPRYSETVVFGIEVHTVAVPVVVGRKEVT